MRTASLRNLAAKSPNVVPVRGAKIVGPSTVTPAYEWNGKVYRKQLVNHTNTAALFNVNERALFKKDLSYRYTVYGLIPTFFLFYWLNSHINGPANKAFWKEKVKQDWINMHKEDWDI